MISFSVLGDQVEKQANVNAPTLMELFQVMIKYHLGMNKKSE